jgi:hypothetical protein
LTTRLFLPQIGQGLTLAGFTYFSSFRTWLT